MMAMLFALLAPLTAPKLLALTSRAAEVALDIAAWTLVTEEGLVVVPGEI